MLKEYLVEICLQDWSDRIKLKSRTIDYVEVVAETEDSAKLIAFKQFMDKTKYSPIARRKWDRIGLWYNEVKCGDIVEI